MTKPPQNEPKHAIARECSRRSLARGKFVDLQEIRWCDAQGMERLWESAERVAQPRAVLIIAHLQPSGRIVLIRQFRPPAKGLVWEFPAGLIGEGETPEVAAAREMIEETGYRGAIQAIYPAAFNSPGLTSESAHIVRMQIDERLQENRNPAAKPDDGESIEVALVGRNELPEFVAREITGGTSFDSKVLAYLCGHADRL